MAMFFKSLLYENQVPTSFHSLYLTAFVVKSMLE